MVAPSRPGADIPCAGRRWWQWHVPVSAARHHDICLSWCLSCAAPGGAPTLLPSQSAGMETLVINVAMVCDLIVKKLGSKASTLTLDADTVLDSVGLSSLQIADIVYTIEDQAGIELDPR